MTDSVKDLIAQEGWEIVDNRVKVYNRFFPITHPALIHLKLYRTERSIETRYLHMKAAHDYLWPDAKKTWHYWTERRFKEHCEGHNYIGWAGGASTAKAQPLTAKVHTPYGWKKMGEIRPGDLISAIDGSVQSVTKIHPQGIQEIYKVTLSDGATTEVTGDHLWRVQSKKQRDKNAGKHHVLTTKELLAHIERQYSVPEHEPLQYLHETSLPMHPWLLGYYIANGHGHIDGTIELTVPLHDCLLQSIKAYWPNCAIIRYPNHLCYKVKLYGARPIIHSFPELRGKKSVEKKIPEIYLNADINSRLALLQGLLDGDGSKSGPGIDVSFSNKHLCLQVVDLARSLGYQASMSNEKESSYYCKKKQKKIICAPHWRVYVSLKSTLPIPATRINPDKRIRTKHRVIKTIEYVRHDYAQCITVSHTSALYITDDYIVTHNSMDAAKIVLLFWLANPTKRTVIVASTTLESLTARVWGYTTKLLSTLDIKLPFRYLSGNSPKILYPASSKDGEIRDTIHGIYAVAAKQGSDESAISSWIGRHPDDALLVVLDECTDLNPAISKAFPNLDSSEKPFQLIGIGNSNSTTDLHGAICTPKDGWNTVDPLQHNKWETTQKNGICLFFSCYESPALYENDVTKKRALSKFLITAEQIKEKEKLLGADSESFYRFVLGFWKSSSTESVVLSKEFIQTHHLEHEVEWSGYEPLQIVAGLDPAFSTGGDKCILRLGYLGQTVDGKIVLDFRNRKLLFDIQIQATTDAAAEIQIAKQVCDILYHYGCPIHHLAIDASGQGRALGGTILLEAQHRHGTMKPPIKIYNVRVGGKKNSFDVVPKTRHELWFDLRRFAEEGSIKGLDPVTIAQFATRLIVQNEKTGKQELELKSAYKKRMAAIRPILAHSPDEADAATLCLQSAILNFGFHPGQKRDLPKMQPGIMQEIQAWKANVRQVQEKHLKGPDLGYPVADFSGGIDSILKSNKVF